MFLARFKPISNQGDWATSIYMTDRASGAPIDLAGSNITAVLAAQLLGDDSAGAGITGGTATGEITFPSVGYMQIFFPVTRMQAMAPGSYRIGLTITNGVYTKQLILGILQIVAGIINLASSTPFWDDYS